MHIITQSNAHRNLHEPLHYYSLRRLSFICSINFIMLLDTSISGPPALYRLYDSSNIHLRYTQLPWKRPSLLARDRVASTCSPSVTPDFPTWSCRVMILIGCASVLKTHSSSEITEVGENRRYRYFSVSARKKLCIMLSFTPVLTWKQETKYSQEQVVRLERYVNSASQGTRLVPLTGNADKHITMALLGLIKQRKVMTHDSQRDTCIFLNFL